MSERNLLFPFQIPQKNYDKVQPSALVCDKCLYDLSELKYASGREYLHPAMEMEGESKYNYDGSEFDGDEPIDSFNIQLDTCAHCKSDYIITSDEFHERAETNRLGSHTCDECLINNGFDDCTYIQKKVCLSCRSTEPYDLSLTGRLQMEILADECAFCCINEDRDNEEDRNNDMPFKIDDIPKTRESDNPYIKLNNDIRKTTSPKKEFWCEDYGEYYISLFEHTNVAYMIYVPPSLAETPRLSFSIVLLYDDIVRLAQMEASTRGAFELTPSRHHDEIEQMMFEYDTDHHNTYSPTFEGQEACLRAALKYAQQTHKMISSNVKIS